MGKEVSWERTAVPVRRRKVVLETKNCMGFRG